MISRSSTSFGGLSESLDLNHIFSRMEENLRIDFKRECSWRDEPTPDVKPDIGCVAKMDSDEGYYITVICTLDCDFPLIFHFCRFEFRHRLRWNIRF